MVLCQLVYTISRVGLWYKLVMDRYLDFTFYHPPLCKAAVVEVLFSIAIVLPSSNTLC